MIYADVDGDGRKDRAVLLAGWRLPWHAWQDRVVVSLATGRRLTLPIDEQGTYRYPYSALLGVADVNADGRAELVLLTGGNTAHYGVIVTETAGHLAIAGTRTKPGAIYPESPLYFYGVGNGCGQWCDLTSSCQLVRGKPRLVTVYGSNPWRYGQPLDRYRKRWFVKVYRLRGSRLILTGSHHGSAAKDERLPHQWPFLNSLSCGTAHWPAS